MALSASWILHIRPLRIQTSHICQHPVYPATICCCQILAAAGGIRYKDNSFSWGVLQKKERKLSAGIGNANMTHIDTLLESEQAS